MKRLCTFLSLFLFMLAVPSQGQKKSSSITPEELRNHLKYLASDELGGRRAGTPGADLAANYLAKEFKEYGLKALGDNGSYLQSFEFVSGVKLGKKNSIAANISGKGSELILEKEMRPVGFSASGDFSGDVVFAGYGIVASEKNYDDYAGIDVEGKAVLLFRFHPEGGNAHSEFGQYAGLRYKAAKAKEKGAKALLIVTGPADTDTDEPLRLSYDQSVGNAGILAVSITQEAANRLLSMTGTTVKQLQDEINGSLKPKSFPVKQLSLTAHVEIEEIKGNGKNVVGFLEGSDPVLKNEIIVIGAHYDHLGSGGEGSGSLRPDTLAIHNGADDNGSGTVGLLELAQFFADRRPSLKRSLAFVAFTAEEMGLLGSAYFVKNPTFPLERVVTMVNMDMIGRLSDRKLIVYGIGTSPGFEDLVLQHNSDSSFDLKLNRDGFGPSDQSSFYGKNIPVFHFFTDLHSDYHRPSDDWDKINYDGMKDVLEYVQTIVADLNRLEKKPEYVQVEQPRTPTTGSGRGIRSYTGTIPDFGEQVEGMKLSGVREGSPAAKAELQAGDIIIKFGTIEIKNLYDYTFALGEYKPGDEVEVVFKRGDEIKKTKVVLERRN